MNKKPTFFSLAVSLLVPVAVFAQASDLPPKAARDKSVATVEELAAQTEAAVRPLPDGMVNPFDPATEEPAQVSQTTTAAPTVRAVPVATDYDKLRTMVPLVNPTGTVIMGGEPILLFGQKRVRIGDALPVIFEGKSYDLTVSAIERTSFTLRMGEAEITRPIKPTSKP